MNWQEVEETLQIKTQRVGLQKYSAVFDELPGVSFEGYGDSPAAARYQLLVKLLATANSHMARVLDRIGMPRGPLDLNLAWQFCDDGRLLLHISNPLGEKTTRVARWQPKRREDDD